MNYIFFGTPQFAAIVLEKLIEADLVPSLVICNPDKPVGRKQIITSPPAKLVAQKHGIKVYQPENLKDELKIENLKLEISKADVAIVTAYGKIIPKTILGIPKYGFLNVHPSLLPKYRGPTPIQSVILDGIHETGVTLFVLDEEVDHGPVLAKRTVQIGRSNYKELEQKLAEESTALLIETLPKYAAREIKPEPQDHDAATFTKKFSTDDAHVGYQNLVTAMHGKNMEKAEQIERMMRALNPEPGVWTVIKGEELNLPAGKRVKLLEAELSGEGLILTKIQVEGKQPRVFHTPRPSS